MAGIAQDQTPDHVAGDAAGFIGAGNYDFQRQLGAYGGGSPGVNLLGATDAGGPTDQLCSRVGFGSFNVLEPCDCGISFVQSTGKNMRQAFV